MNALYFRSRIQWAIVGLAIGTLLFAITYYIYVVEGDRAGFACYITAITGIFFIRQFVFFPPKIGLEKWWVHSVSPGYYGIPRTGGDVRIIRPNGKRMNIIFDLNGNCIGDEDYILGKWSFHPIDSDCRYNMPAIALWRTRRRLPKLPEGNLAEVHDGDEVVGHTTYNRR